MAVYMNLLEMVFFLVCFAAVAEFSSSRTKRLSLLLHDQINSRMKGERRNA